MKEVYITIAGGRHHLGDEFLEPGMTVRLKKEPGNEADSEAIRVELDGLGLLGYVANSVFTRVGESWSAGRLYDKIGDTAEARVKYRIKGSAVCVVSLPEENA